MRKMKDSGVEWIGKIPEDWKVGRVKDIFIRKNEKADEEDPIVLSLTRSGVKIRDISTGEGQLAESYKNYNPVEIDDFLLNPMDLYSGANCSISRVRGVISPAYINLRAKGDNNPAYYDYYFKTQYWGMVLFSFGKGVSYKNRWTLGLDTALNYFITIPPIPEQQKIAQFLDNRVATIDNIIDKTKETIEDYKKYKQSLITEVVTKGLDKNAEMKDSGVEWIGKIPEDWKVVKTKIVFKYHKDIVGDKEKLYQRLSLTLDGVKKRSKDDTKGLQSEKFSTYQILNKKELVFKMIDLNNVNTSRVGYSLYTGLVSPVYIILNNEKYTKFGYYYFYDMWQREIFNNLGNDGVRSSLSISDMLNIPFIFMSFREADKIAQFLDNKIATIDNLILAKQRIIDELKQYKKSLIYEYVTGKKEVR